jgi:hypothetical protein
VSGLGTVTVQVLKDEVPRSLEIPLPIDVRPISWPEPPSYVGTKVDFRSSKRCCTIVRAEGGKRMATASSHIAMAIRYSSGVAQKTRHFPRRNGLNRTPCRDSMDDTRSASCLKIFHMCCVNAIAKALQREALNAATSRSDIEVT